MDRRRGRRLQIRPFEIEHPRAGQPRLRLPLAALAALVVAGCGGDSPAPPTDAASADVAIIEDVVGVDAEAALSDAENLADATDVAAQADASDAQTFDVSDTVQPDGALRWFTTPPADESRSVRFVFRGGFVTTPVLASSPRFRLSLLD